MLKEGHQKANLELDKAQLSIDEELSSLEVAGQNIYSLWPENRNAGKAEVITAFHNFLNANPNVQGVAVGMEPEEYPEYPKGFSPYVLKIDGGFRETMLSDTRKYREADWYKKTKDTNRPRWSNPFREVNGSVIVSYCIPLHNASGKFVGVLAVDLGLSNLTKKLQKIRPHDNTMLTVMDRNFKFLVHPNTQYILNKSAHNLLEQAHYHPNESIYVDMKRRVRGLGVYNDGKETHFLYYAPVRKADWTITLDYPRKEVLKGVTQIRREMFAISLLGLLGLLAVAIIVARRMVRPIKQFSKAASQIAGGDFNTTLPQLKDKDELWQLGDSLDNMQKSLKQYIADLKATTKEKGRIESELHIASQIQMAMIPKIFPPYPNRTDVDIYGSLIPAKEVGGDLYDFFIHDEKLFFCIGDVSGKGIPASLVMAVTRSLVRIVAAREDRPGIIVEALNDSMADMNESNMFVTMFVGVLDLGSGLLRYCNAGHDAPMIAGPEAGKAEMLNVESNLPIAVLANMKFKEQEISLQSNTSIFLYTDGLNEAENPQKELFGDERMLQAIKEISQGTPKQQVEFMNQVVLAHVNGAEQSDDLTMLSIKCIYGMEQNKPHAEPHLKHATFHNNIKDVPSLGEFIDGVGDEEHIDPATVNSINLALEEAVVNVMNYAYPEGTVGAIELDSSVTPDEWQFTLADKGKPFDPTQVEEPDTTIDVEERPIGGLGIFLVRQIMDSVTYERKGDENILTLTKKLNKTK